MANITACLSTGPTGWSTPLELFDPLDAAFRFELDVCATAANTRCIDYITPELDGLAQPWAPRRCWCNPPYGRTETPRWVRKAVEEARQGALVVMLLPARTETRCWHEAVMPNATEVCLLKGRVRFGAASSGAPFPSAVIVFDGQGEAAPGLTLWDWRREPWRARVWV